MCLSFARLHSLVHIPCCFYRLLVVAVCVARAEKGRFVQSKLHQRLCYRSRSTSPLRRECCVGIWVLQYPAALLSRSPASTQVEAIRPTSKNCSSTQTSNPHWRLLARLARHPALVPRRQQRCVTLPAFALPLPISIANHRISIRLPQQHYVMHLSTTIASGTP